MTPTKKTLRYTIGFEVPADIDALEAIDRALEEFRGVGEAVILDVDVIGPVSRKPMAVRKRSNNVT